MPEPEVWLRGQIPAIPALLQPVAHSLIQCREDLTARVTELTPDQIWARPCGAASIGFHARHAAGSLDRLFTYARGERLSSAQQAALAAEGNPDLAPDIDRQLVAAFDRAVERALEQLRTTSETTLLEVRGVGRAQLPSTVLGLLFHAAEHTQRHVGQLVTTARAFSSGWRRGSMDQIERERAVSLYEQLLGAWNRRRADDFAACFAEDGNSVGFDGSPLDGRAAIASALQDIFAHHPTAAYVGKVRDLRRLEPDVMLLRAVVGMVPPGHSELDAALNAIQSVVIIEQDRQLKVALLHNTPAAFHGRPELAAQLTEELKEVLRSGQIVAG